MMIVKFIFIWIVPIFHVQIEQICQIVPCWPKIFTMMYMIHGLVSYFYCLNLIQFLPWYWIAPKLVQYLNWINWYQIVTIWPISNSRFSKFVHCISLVYSCHIFTKWSRFAHSANLAPLYTVTLKCPNLIQNSNSLSKFQACFPPYGRVERQFILKLSSFCSQS